MAEALNLTLAQRADWLAHCYKALARQHHREDESYLRAVLPANGVAIDVGAHAGQYTKLFAKIASSGFVYAFEPGAYALSILQKVVRYRHLRNVRVVASALSDKEGEIQFNLPIKQRGNLGFGIAYLGNADGKRAARQSTVRMTTLDAFAEKVGLMRVDFIKADIEGWELHMLRGATAVLDRFRPVLQLEASDALLKRAGTSEAELMRFLDEHGYAGSQLPNGDFLFKPQQPPRTVRPRFTSASRREALTP